MSLSSELLQVVRAIEGCGHPDEQLASWSLSESAVTGGTEDSRLLQGPLRSCVAYCVHHHLDVFALAQNSGGQVMALLDVYLDRNTVPFDVAALPGACVAACAVLSKLDHRLLLHRTKSVVELFAGNFVWLLREAGNVHAAEACEEFSARQRVLQAQRQAQREHELDLAVTTELSFLQVVQWRTNVPTTEMWMSAFCERFDVATKHRCRPSLEWVLRTQTLHAHKVLLTISTLTLRSRDFAIGLLCNGLVAAKLLDSSVLESCPGDQGRQVASESAENEAAPLLLVVLQLVTGATVEELQAHARTATSTMAKSC